MKITNIGLIVALLVSIFNFSNSYSQNLIRGKVLDKFSNSGIPNVNIIESGSGLKTVTDSLGYFQFFSLSNQLDLTVSKIGYETYTGSFVPNDSLLLIYLNSLIINIDEVEVNTGYEWIPRERATGSFVTIGKDVLENIPGTSIINKLNGVMPGLLFDNRSNGATTTADPVITVRGLNSFNTYGSNPLIVVDNFPYEGEIENINPNEVESVTLLRDAAAASIWGVRAGNGVIIINLKKPEKSEKIEFNFSSKFSITEKPDLFYDEIMSSADFIETERFLYENNYYKSSLNSTNAIRTVFSPIVHGLFDLERGLISEEYFNNLVDYYKQKDYRNDLLKYYYRNSVLNQNHLSISRSYGKNSFRLSLGIDRVNGENNFKIGNQRSSKYTINFYNYYKFSPKLSTNLSINYAFSDRNTGGGDHYPFNPFGGKTQLYPYAELIGPNGEELPLPRDLNVKYVDTVGSGKLLDWKYWPLDNANHIHNFSKSSRINPSVTLRFTPYSFFYLEGLINGEYQITKENNRLGTNSYDVRNNINKFSQILNEDVIRRLPYGEILLNNYSDYEAFRARLNAKFDRVFYNRNRLVLVLGGELSHSKSTNISNRFYGYNPSSAVTVPVDYMVNYPLIYGGSGTIPNGDNLVWFLRRLLSLYGNFSYTFSEKYILSGSFRKDASNVFGALANERWNPLMSVGLAWNIHNEEFFKNIDWINKLKFKATYGNSGNLGGGTTSDRVVITIQGARSGYTNLPFGIITSPPNTSLKWEKVHTINFGIDFSLFKSKFSGTIDFFNKKVTDLISTDEIDPTTGFNAINKNVAGIKSKGFDLHFTFDPFTSNFRWRINGSISHVRDWTTAYYGAKPSSAVIVSSDNSIRPMIGQTLMPVYSYKFAGLDPENGDPLGYYKGEISKNYTTLLNDSLQFLIFHGSARPIFHGHMNNKISYKNIAIGFNISFKAGHYFRNSTIKYNNLFTGWETHSDFSKRWKNPGDEQFTSVPSMVYPAVIPRDNFFAGSEINVYKGDLIRLKSINATYSLKIKNKTPREFMIGVNAENLGIIWKAANVNRDPDYLSIPPSKIYSVYLNINL